MSVTMSKADGVTVLTLTSDSQSLCPPLCQILMRLCYSPVCCIVNPHLKRAQTGVMNVLGTLQIMTGLLSIGLSVILTCSRSAFGWGIGISFPYWTGGLFVLFGILCILAERFPSPCLVIFNMLLHVVGVAIAITAIVLHSIKMGSMRLWWNCDNDYRYNYYYHRRTTPSPNPEVEELLKEKCWEGKAMILMLLRSISAVLIVLSVLELCVVISAFVQGVKTLRTRRETPDQSAQEPEYYKPLLEDASIQAPA